jgi:hypothetical protein
LQKEPIGSIGRKMGSKRNDAVYTRHRLVKDNENNNSDKDDKNYKNKECKKENGEG